MKAIGTAHKYGDNIDTDIIIPARYLNISSYKELGLHCLEDLDKEFLNKVSVGDIIVAKENFGCGSSREHAPIAIKSAGIACVIATNFARIFYRNAINIGLPILECKEAADVIDNTDKIEIDFDTGIILNITKDRKYKTEPFPNFIQNIIKNGGLLNSILKNKMTAVVNQKG